MLLQNSAGCDGGRGAGLTVHWYGSAKSALVDTDRATLAADGIVVEGLLPEPALTARLRTHRYVLVPTGTLNAYCLDIV